MSACWPLQMPPTPKAVLVSLADNANDHGECWPSISTISERTCFSERAVQNAIHWLEDHNLILADRTDGRHTRYAIVPDRFQPPQEMHPRRRCTPAGDSETPAPRAPHPRTSCTPPPQEVPSNRKEPSKNRKSNQKKKHLELSFACWPSEPNAEVLGDWLAVRKKKRADVSETVIQAMGKQLHLAATMGWTVDECLTECVLRNWQALKAEWLQPKNGKPHEAHQGNRKLSAVEQVEQAIRERRAKSNGEDPVALIGYGRTLDAHG